MVPVKDSPRPLNVTIVGAGIGGLAAAIALRQNGHHVRILEASQTKVEVGAGIGVQENALRILKRFGFSRENVKPVDFDGAVVFDAKNGVGIKRPWLIPRPDGSHDVVCHRSDLHDELTRLAIGDGERGTPVQILLSSKVVACDPKDGTVTLDNGEIIHADVVIGADGIHSVIRTHVLGYSVKAPATGWTCFRCLFDASTLDKLTDLEWLTEGLHGPRTVIMREKALRMFFIYPVRSGTLINFVGIYTDPEQDRPDWTPTGTVEEIREKFQEFHPKFLRLLDLSPATPILKWQLRALPDLPTWISGRVALLGDAAHATLPLLGQGAAMAIEEAGALGCLLPLGTTTEDVPARLEAYQTLRKERGEFVRAESILQAEVPAKRGSFLRSREMQASLIEHDTIKITQEYYDAHFGGGIKV
ncbi:FAD/NAD(P)-binding domain-containing protein [Mycena leptocephala]|nr:FAD/NAD(P)-binding domain-containing protein [Mycena leptocephala]